MSDYTNGFSAGIEYGYALAVEDLRTALEAGRVPSETKKALALLEKLSIDAAARWMESDGEPETENGVSSPA